MSMVSKTLCSHFACQGSYYATHTLGLNFTIKSRAESLALMSVIMHGLTWSERNYCAWFDGTVFEQPALVCHGSQLRHGVASSPNLNLFQHVWKFEIWSLNLNFRYMATHKHTRHTHTHASSNAITLVWGLAQARPNYSTPSNLIRSCQPTASGQSYTRHQCLKG